MSYFLPVIYTLLQLFALMLFGFGLAKSGRWPKEFFQQLSRLMVKFGLPFYFFANLCKTNAADVRQSLIFPVVAVMLMAICWGFATLSFRLFAPNHRFRRAGIALSTFGNYGYIPSTLIELFPLTLPILSARFSPSVSTLYISTFLLVGSPALWSFGNFLVAGKGRIPKVRELITPPLFGILAGLAVVMFNAQSLILDQRFPLFYLVKTVERIGAVTFPLVMICLGAMIANIRYENINRREFGSFVAIVMLTRFLWCPAAFFFAYAWLAPYLTPTQWWVIFLESNIPPATNLSIMAAQAGMNEDQVSFTLMVTNLAYLLVLPVSLILFFSLPGILR